MTDATEDDQTIWQSSGEPRLALELRTLTNGTSSWRQPVVSQGNGIAGAVVCAETDQGLLLVGATRPLAGGRLVELPRGWTDRADEQGDDEQWAIATAVRECREETGATVRDARFVGWLWADTGLLASKVGVVWARVDTMDQPRDAEADEVMVVSRDELRRLVDEHQIRDGITLGGLALCHWL